MPSPRARADRPSRLRVWSARLASAVAGGFLALAFPPFDLPWPSILVAVAAWFALTEGLGARESAFRSFAFAFGFQLVLLRWLTVVGQDAWLALAVLEAVFFIPVGIVRAISTRPFWSLALVAAAWPAMDWARDHAGPVAFGWGQLPFASMVAPWAALAPWLSQEVVTAYIVSLGGAVALLLRERLSVRVTALGLVTLALSLPLLLASVEEAEGSGVRIALVQGGVDRIGLGAFGDRRVVMYRHASLTRALLPNSNVALIVWPENSVDVDPYDDSEARAALASAAEATGVPLLFGALLQDADGRRNVSVLAQGTGLRTVYTKQRLVPFGEVLPARSLLSRYIERTNHIPVDFIPGSQVGVLNVSGVNLGILICFEIADEDGAQAVRDAGAAAIVVQTNNATYAGLGQSQQQLRIAQYRAKSLGLPVYVVSTSGPTAVIARNGKILQILDEQRVGILVAELPAVRVNP